MFKTNPDGMRMEPTPERVLSVCRMAARGKITRESLRDALTFGKNEDKGLNQEVDRSIDVALKELGILKMKDGSLELAEPAEVIASARAFRRYVSAKVFYQKDTTFFMFSKWLIAQNERLFSLHNWEVMAKTCAAENSELSGLDENAVLGWRFWASFLGLGYLSRTMFLPNMKLRLQDLLAAEFAQTFRYGETIRGTDFAFWLSSRLPEADISSRWPLAVSAGLRTLRDLGLIRLETWQDSSRIMLYSVDGDPNNDFSHITVYEEVCR
ncbi:MAG: hypothetical protein IJ496_02515 [Ruminococcus sp.]|nr:hypothetical protein [Ruminococcus sp.]